MTTAELLANENSYEDYAEDEEEISDVDDYDISTSPNDFNVSTMYDFIKSRVLVIPSFQRNYVWDIKRASKLIESLIIGLPVPQIFLYEAGRNSFHVIDGQQRLMSIYYFIEKRFPRMEERAELRRIFAENGRIPEDVLKDDKYFADFRLVLPERISGVRNRLNGLQYDSLDDYELAFKLRTIRNVIIRQNSPKNEESSIYEIFSRLNTGGVNLSTQEIRSSLYHSDFYNMLMRVNYESGWRHILRDTLPDLRLKDVELLLRMFAMLDNVDDYSSSMSKFLDGFSKKCESNSKEKNQYLEDVFKSFLKTTEHLPSDAFTNKGNNRVNIALVEAVFSATCRDKYQKAGLVEGRVDFEEIRALETDPDFLDATQRATTQKTNVIKRLERGYALVTPL